MSGWEEIEVPTEPTVDVKAIHDRVARQHNERIRAYYAERTIKPRRVQSEAEMEQLDEEDGW